MTTNKNDSAFPYMEGQTRGLTKREDFAKAMMQAFVTGYASRDDFLPTETTGNDSVRYADALIAALNGTGESS